MFSVGMFSPAHLRWIIGETLLSPNALETGSLNCCLLGRFFRILKVYYGNKGGGGGQKKLR